MLKGGENVNEMEPCCGGVNKYLALTTNRGAGSNCRKFHLDGVYISGFRWAKTTVCGLGMICEECTIVVAPLPHVA